MQQGPGPYDSKQARSRGASLTRSSPGVDPLSRGGFGVEGGRGLGVEGGLGFELPDCGVRGGGGGGRGLAALSSLAASSVRRLLPVSVCARPGEGPLGGLGRDVPSNDGLSPDDDRPCELYGDLWRDDPPFDDGLSMDEDLSRGEELLRDDPPRDEMATPFDFPSARLGSGPNTLSLSSDSARSPPITAGFELFDEGGNADIAAILSRSAYVSTAGCG